MREDALKHGAGHTAAIHTNNEALVREYGLRMHACRIIWNQPSSLGGIGDIYNAIAPSLTLGCGSYGGNSVSGNVQAVNLINIKRIARRNNNMQWFKIPAKTYFEPNAIKYLRDMYGIEKAVIVCDKVMEQLGIVDKIIDQLRARDNRVTFRIIDYVEPEPSVETVERGAEMMREEFEPDTIIAVGGGSPMDAAKIMWLLYEHPEIAFSDVREKFFDIRKRAFKIPPLGEKAKLVCIPTSSGTGSEVTPFAVITDHKTGYKYPITDYALTPSVAIVDPVLARTQPRKLASDAGFDALTHSLEAYVSVYANDFTDGMALHAAKLIWDNLAESVNGEPGLAKTDAQEKMHNAATMAGMAFGSAFLGMCHGMAHTIGACAHRPRPHQLHPAAVRDPLQRPVPEEPTSWPKYNKYIAPQALPGHRPQHRHRPGQDPGRRRRESGEGRRGLPRQQARHEQELPGLRCGRGLLLVRARSDRHARLRGPVHPGEPAHPDDQRHEGHRRGRILRRLPGRRPQDSRRARGRGRHRRGVRARLDDGMTSPIPGDQPMWGLPMRKAPTIISGDPALRWRGGGT